MRRRIANAEKRKIGENFIDYLTRHNLIRTWHRQDLKLYYDSFTDERKRGGLRTISFSNALFALARFGRPELAVRRGTTVVFRGSRDFHSRRSIPVTSRITSEHVDIQIISQDTRRTALGFIARKVCDASSGIELELRNSPHCYVPSRIIECRVISRREDFKVEWTESVTTSKINPTILIRALKLGGVQMTEIEITLEVGRGKYEKCVQFLRFEVTEGLDLEYDVPDLEIKTRHDMPGTTPVSFKGYIPGVKPDTLHDSDLKMPWSLDYVRIPEELKSAWKRHAFTKSRTLGDFELEEELTTCLTITNYSRKYKMLLHIEELQNKRDIKQYDIEDGTLYREIAGSKLLYLDVPGLAEKRPSVLRGDKVYVKRIKRPKELESISYQGYVHHVEQNRVTLGFNSQLLESHIENMRYYVRFDFNRLPLKLMHRSSNAMPSREDAEEILFPSSGRTYLGTVKSVRLFNRILQENSEQMNAVEAITSGNTSKVFIIFGPPGTGKTITMVEAIHQKLRSSTETANMLVCAPSNSACDLLTTRLLRHVDKREIFRMHAASRYWEDVPSDVKEVSNYGNRKFYFPPKDELLEHRIVVTTLVTAGRIASANFPKNHFNYVFIDEAGQAMEPEAMIAVAGILSEKGKIILAGDPKQLGPIIRSSVANEHGLQLSFLERLMTTSHVHGNMAVGGFDPACVVKLIKNYRSHESIIHVSNELFYKKELQVCADEFIRNSFCHWEGLPRKGFPVIFHGVEGEEKQEEKSPSFFNPEEIVKVMSYIDSILSVKRSGVITKQIGVITPYRKQVQKIKQELASHPDCDRKRLNLIKVGSVEEFQGQERRVIILSTVRSHTKHLKHDAKFNLGFLRNPKRFNVAVTRAQALMIIIGNPKLLSLDPYWRAILKHCMSNGGYTGTEFDQSDIDRHENTSFEAYERMLNELKINDEDCPKATTDQANPQWRQDP